MSNSQHSFYFGLPGKSLLGVYYPPASIVAQRNHSILLCPAFGQEYLRSHRAFRQLAMLLAREGFHVLRFDYFGTGDSEGLIQNSTMDQWLADIGTAADELFNITGCEHRSLIGLRLGASLALLHSSYGQTANWDSVSLWEPVISGAQYLADFGHSDQEPLENLMGFPLHSELRNAIAALDLTQLDSCGTSKLNCVTSTTDENLSRMLGNLEKTASVSHAVIPIQGDWAKTDEFLSAMLPREMILNLIDGLKSAATS